MLEYEPQVPNDVPLLGDADGGEVRLSDVHEREALLDGGAPRLPLVPLHVVGVHSVELVVVLLAAMRLVRLCEPAWKVYDVLKMGDITNL